MKYIEISDGLSIKIDDIEAIQYMDELSCKIMTRYNEYQVNFPYMTFLQILENSGKEENSGAETLNKIYQIVRQQGHFAG